MTIINNPATGSLDTASLDTAIAELTQGAQRWAVLGHQERARLFAEVQQAIGPQAAAWAQIAAKAKGIPLSSQLVGEEWTSGPYATAAGAATLSHSFAALDAGRSPLDGATVSKAPGRRLAVRVLPRDLREYVLFHGHDIQVWTKPDITAEQLREKAGLGALRPGESGGVGLVLGAGNISSIAPLDAFYELAAFNRASIVKLNPTFASLQSVYEAALAPLIELGLVRIVQGAAEVGGYLTQHPGISHVHITGSSLTHDAIVWGTGTEAAQRRSADDPKLATPITSELGGVAPIIVVPGHWSTADLHYQAEHVATMRLHNGGHNCVAGQALIVSADWEQKDAFLAAVRTAFDRIAPRAPWYPGSEAKLAAARSSHPQAEEHGGRLIVSVPADRVDELCSTEYFAPVLGVTELPGTGAQFLMHAVAFSNDRLAGTLGGNIIVAPADRTAMGADWDRAIAEFRYGTIAINSWTGVGFLAPGATWGAFPGHTLHEVGSGIGVVHNGLLLDDVERSVVTGPFRPFPRSVLAGEFSLFPKPPWWVTARSAAATGRKLAAYAVKPSWAKLPGIFFSAFRA